MKKNTKDIAKRYAAEAKASGRSMETCIRKFLEHQATIDANFSKAYMPEKFNDCIKFVCDCAREILSSKSGDVPDEICYKMARDFFNDRLWEEEETQEEKPAEKPKKAKKEKKKPEPKEEKPVVITASADEVEEPVAEEKPAPVKASPAAFNVNQLDLFGFGV